MNSKARDVLVNHVKHVMERGTANERTALRDDIRIMNELGNTFPGSEWTPMDSVRLIDWDMERAERLAQTRWRKAHEQHYRDYQGKVGRTLHEERLTARGHIAAQHMLGLPLGKPETKEEARSVGNVGGGHNVFQPVENIFHHHLIVDPRRKNDLIEWLIVPDGERSFRLTGWILAEDAKSSEYQKVRQREGGQSVAYWVPPEALGSVASWWDRYTY